MSCLWAAGAIEGFVHTCISPSVLLDVAPTSCKDRVIISREQYAWNNLKASRALRPRSHLAYIRDGDAIGWRVTWVLGLLVDTPQVTLVGTQHEDHGLQAGILS